jgi:hypothetical protein
MTQDRPAFDIATSSKARHMTSPWHSVRAAAGIRPAAVPSHRFFGHPTPPILVPAPPRDACLECICRIAYRSRKPRVDQRP